VAQQARWLDFIEQFDLKVEHRAGTSHRAADALSRRPCDDTGLCPQCSKRRTGWSDDEASFWQAAIIPSEGHVKVTTRSQARNTPRLDSPSDGAPDPSGGSGLPSDGASGQGDGSSSPVDGSCHRGDGATGPGDGSSPPSDGESRQKERSSPPGNWVEVNEHLKEATLVSPVEGPAESQGLGWSQEELISFQRSDETLGIVAAWSENQARPNWKETLSQDPELRAYWLQWDSLEL